MMGSRRELIINNNKQKVSILMKPLQLLVDDQALNTKELVFFFFFPANFNCFKLDQTL